MTTEKTVQWTMITVTAAAIIGMGIAVAWTVTRPQPTTIPAITCPKCSTKLHLEITKTEMSEAKP